VTEGKQIAVTMVPLEETVPVIKRVVEALGSEVPVPVFRATLCVLLITEQFPGTPTGPELSRLATKVTTTLAEEILLVMAERGEDGEPTVVSKPIDIES